MFKFPNDVCVGSGTMNGTCYTEEECSNKEGTAAGSCADGFGVCCVISLACGDTTYDNCTYLSQASTTTPGSGCTYKICPISTSVNRIRLDFTTFEIASPVVPTDVTGEAGPATLTEGGAIGHCATDTFTATGAPVICGKNTGQHMVLDTDGSTCINVVFSYGGDTEARTYNIHVTQFDALNDMGGPTGCLQYFTADTGTIMSFNFKADAAIGNIGSQPHLANQDYSICIRRNADKCAICYSESITYIVGSGAISVTGTFGVSTQNANSATADPQNALAGALCQTDFITIPNGLAGLALGVTTPGVDASATAAMVTMIITAGVPVAGVERYCGRQLGPFDAANPLTTVSHTVCSLATPFSVGVFFDGTEAVATGSKEKQKDSEVSTGGATVSGAAGTYGFSLGFAQLACS